MLTKALCTWEESTEGYFREQLTEVRQQSAEALDIFIRDSYSGFGVKVAADQNFPKPPNQGPIICGPPEADGLVQWKAGLIASNQTWYVIDRGLQLVPIWDIILSSHRSNFKDPLQVANFLKDSYTAVTSITAHIQDEEELLSAGKEARIFLEDVKSWEISDLEEQLKKLIIS
ncbi:Interferon-induced very large GTPase 1 [Plecturocebus cupreus]